MKPLEPKPPDPCPLASSFLSWSPPCPDSSLNLLRSVTRFQWCSTCSNVAGFNLPCSGLICSRLGICCTFVIPQWSTRILKAPPLKPSLAFIAVLIANLGFVGMVLDDSILVFNVEESPICQYGSQIRLRTLVQLRLFPSFGRIKVLPSLATYGVLMDALYQLNRGSCYSSEQSVPEGQLLTLYADLIQTSSLWRMRTSREAGLKSASNCAFSRGSNSDAFHLELSL